MNVPFTMDTGSSRFSSLKVFNKFSTTTSIATNVSTSPPPLPPPKDPYYQLPNKSYTSLATSTKYNSTSATNASMPPTPTSPYFASSNSVISNGTAGASVTGKMGLRLAPQAPPPVPGTYNRYLGTNASAISLVSQNSGISATGSTSTSPTMYSSFPSVTGKKSKNGGGAGAFLRGIVGKKTSSSTSGSEDGSAQSIRSMKSMGTLDGASKKTKSRLRAFLGGGDRTDAGDDESISPPWNFQHNIHVDEGLTGLPPSWSALLSEQGYSEEEIAMIVARRRQQLQVGVGTYTPGDRPISPVAVIQPAPRSTSLRQQPAAGPTPAPLLIPNKRSTSLRKPSPIDMGHTRLGSSVSVPVTVSTSLSIDEPTFPSPIAPSPGTAQLTALQQFPIPPITRSRSNTPDMPQLPTPLPLNLPHNTQPTRSPPPITPASVPPVTPPRRIGIGQTFHVMNVSDSPMSPPPAYVPASGVVYGYGWGDEKREQSKSRSESQENDGTASVRSKASASSFVTGNAISRLHSHRSRSSTLNSDSHPQSHSATHNISSPSEKDDRPLDPATDLRSSVINTNTPKAKRRSKRFTALPPRLSLHEIQSGNVGEGGEGEDELSLWSAALISAIPSSGSVYDDDTGGGIKTGASNLNMAGTGSRWEREQEKVLGRGSTVKIRGADDTRPSAQSAQSQPPPNTKAMPVGSPSSDTMSPGLWDEIMSAVQRSVTIPAEVTSPGQRGHNEPALSESYSPVIPFSRPEQIPGKGKNEDDETRPSVRVSMCGNASPLIHAVRDDENSNGLDFLSDDSRRENRDSNISTISTATVTVANARMTIVRNANASYTYATKTRISDSRPTDILSNLEQNQDKAQKPHIGMTSRGELSIDSTSITSAPPTELDSGTSLRDMLSPLPSLGQTQRPNQVLTSPHSVSPTIVSPTTPDAYAGIVRSPVSSIPGSTLSQASGRLVQVPGHNKTSSTSSTRSTSRSRSESQSRSSSRSQSRSESPVVPSGSSASASITRPKSPAALGPPRGPSPQLPLPLPPPLKSKPNLPPLPPPPATTSASVNTVGTGTRLTRGVSVAERVAAFENVVGRGRGRGKGVDSNSSSASTSPSLPPAAPPASLCPSVNVSTLTTPHSRSPSPANAHASDPSGRGKYPQPGPPTNWVSENGEDGEDGSGSGSSSSTSSLENEYDHKTPMTEVEAETGHEIDVGAEYGRSQGKAKTSVSVSSQSPTALFSSSSTSPLSPTSVYSSSNPSSVSPLSPLQRYNGWLSRATKPLEEFIDDGVDPREWYVDLKEIAEGESGLVYAAKMVYPEGSRHRHELKLAPAARTRDLEDAENGRETFVAIKNVPISPSPDPKSRSRTKLADLHRELNTLRGHSHEHILILDAVYIDLVEDSLWIRMELMERSLADVVGLVSEGLMLQERMIGRFAADIIQALEYLRSQRIAHRDVRSDNLLLNCRGILKLTDFSNAIQLSKEGEMCTDVVGVEYWQAPEVRAGLYNPLKLDVWSLGATIWEMAEAEPPFSATQQLNNRWPPLSKPDLYSPSFHDFLRLCSEPAPSRPEAVDLKKKSFVQNACGRPVIIQLLNQCVGIERRLQEDGDQEQDS